VHFGTICSFAELWFCVILVTFASECPLIAFSYMRIQQNVGKLMNAKGIRPLRDTGGGGGGVFGRATPKTITLLLSFLDQSQPK